MFSNYFSKLSSQNQVYETQGSIQFLRSEQISKLGLAEYLEQHLIIDIAESIPKNDQNASQTSFFNETNTTVNTIRETATNKTDNRNSISRIQRVQQVRRLQVEENSKINSQNGRFYVNRNAIIIKQNLNINYEDENYIKIATEYEQAKDLIQKVNKGNIWERNAGKRNENELEKFGFLRPQNQEEDENIDQQIRFLQRKSEFFRDILDSYDQVLFLPFSHKFYPNDYTLLQPMKDKFNNIQQYIKILYPLMLNDFLFEIHEQSEKFVSIFNSPDFNSDQYLMTFKANILRSAKDKFDNFIYRENKYAIFQIQLDKQNSNKWKQRFPNKYFDVQESKAMVAIIMRKKDKYKLYDIGIMIYQENGFTQNYIIMRSDIGYLDTERQEIINIFPLEKCSTYLNQKKSLFQIAQSQYVKDVLINPQILSQPVFATQEMEERMEFRNSILETNAGLQNNDSQLQSIETATDFSSPISLIHGPPGTGQTHTSLGIVSISLSFIKKQKTQSIIIACSHSNSVVNDWVLKFTSGKLKIFGEPDKNTTLANKNIKIVEKVDNEIQVLRFGSTYQINREVLKHSIEYQAQVQVFKYYKDGENTKQQLKAQNKQFKQNRKKESKDKTQNQEESDEEIKEDQKNQDTQIEFMEDSDEEEMQKFKLMMQREKKKLQNDSEESKEVIEKFIKDYEIDGYTLHDVKERILQNQMQMENLQSLNSREENPIFQQKIIRLINRNSILIRIYDSMQMYLSSNKSRLNYFIYSQLDGVDIIVSTMGSLKSNILEMYLKENEINVEMVLIDEAPQSLEPSCLIPLTYNPKKLVLLGDNKQLAPVYHFEQDAVYLKFNRSLFERILDNDVKSIFLNQQYRSLPEISILTSQFFYNGQIIDGRSVSAAHNSIPNHLQTILKNSQKSNIFFDNNGLGEEHKNVNSTSWSNDFEAQGILQFIVYLLPYVWNLDGPKISVISPYQDQVNALKFYFTTNLGFYAQSLGLISDPKPLKQQQQQQQQQNSRQQNNSQQNYREENENDEEEGYDSDQIKQINEEEQLKLMLFDYSKVLEVDTIDAFQGQENDIIILSLVKTNNLGFTDDIKRMNVATSRAKYLQVIFGHEKCLRKNKTWTEILQHLKHTSFIYEEVDMSVEKIKQFYDKIFQ